MNSPVKIWRNQKYIAKMLGKYGVITAWTVIRVPPAGFAHLAPYPVVTVDVIGDGRITAQLVDWTDSDLAVGRKVRIVVRRVSEPPTEGIIPYGIKVKPI